MGLGYTLTEEIRFKGGEVLDKNFDTYALPRFSQVPQIETVLIDAPEVAGAGRRRAGHRAARRRRRQRDLRRRRRARLPDADDAGARAGGDEGVKDVGRGSCPKWKAPRPPTADDVELPSLIEE